ncbi:MAG: MFS transporter [Chloroflexi bacterium]|nr:MFS transporter [Chloroflexota bacterium]
MLDPHPTRRKTRTAMLSRTFVTLAVAMFSASMGVGIVAPVLPVRAEQLGASGTEVGLTFSAFALTQLLVSPFAGRLADRYGRKPFILLGILTYVVAALGWQQTDNITVVIALRALTGVGSGLVFALALAYVGELAPTGGEGRYMGAFGIFEFLGFGLGPVISGVIRDRVGFDAVFFTMAGMLTLSGLVVIAFLPWSLGRTAVGSAGAGVPPRLVPWRELLGDRALQALFAQRLGWSFAFGSAFSFLAVYLEEEILATATMVGFVLAGQELLGGALQPLFGPLADRFNRRVLVTVGAVIVASGYVALALSTTYLVILAAFVGGAGAGSALTAVSAMALQVDVGRRLGMATAMSLVSAAFAAGVLIGSLCAGVIADGFGVRYVFIAAAAAIVLGAAVFVLLTRGTTSGAAPPPSRPLDSEARGHGSI